MRRSTLRWGEFAVREARLTLAAWADRVGALRPPIAVEDLADLLYLLAIDVTTDLPNTLAGRLYAEQRIIEVRRDDHPRRQRFTIAHELGHYRLHVVAERVHTSNYACSATAIARVVGTDHTPLQPQPTPLPRFAAPHALPAPGPSAHAARRREIEANVFAAELLMPATMVEQAAQHYGPNLTALADLFDVSRQAMQYRLEQLLLLPRPGPQTSFLSDE